MKEWIVKYQCYRQLTGEPVMVVDHFENEDHLSEFCHDNPEDIIEVLEIGHYPLSVEDRTSYYVPEITPSRFQREEARGERIAEMRRELA